MYDRTIRIVLTKIRYTFESSHINLLQIFYPEPVLDISRPQVQNKKKMNEKIKKTNYAHDGDLNPASHIARVHNQTLGHRQF